MRGVCWHQAPANVPALLGVLAGSAATSQAVAPMAPGPTKPTRSKKSPKPIRQHAPKLQRTVSAHLATPKETTGPVSLQHTLLGSAVTTWKFLPRNLMKFGDLAPAQHQTGRRW